ncbi:MAG: Crp/Fnr family transcriptional regulator [Bryobacterales bacterium]|nr:Crp/Fnr family transcriptional regulator [Bryobacterales bacterium]
MPPDDRSSDKPRSAEQTLAQIPMFSSLDAGERATLASLAIERHYQPGALLFTEGMPCDGLYLIGAGIVKIVKTTSSGREIMLALEAAPATVAEVPVFDGGPYPASVMAVRETTAYVIPKPDLHRACREHPEIAMKMLRVTGQRLRQLVTLLQAVTFGSVRQRIARQLIDWQAEFGEGEFSLPLSHEELAMRIGTVREVVSRNLSRFQAEGFLVIERRKVRVLDAEGLRNEAESEL